MLSVLDDDQYRQLAAVAHSLEMGVLTEVSNEEELERAIALGAKVVGINNRDLLICRLISTVPASLRRNWGTT
ncbi:bifunctional indole-3-glycerol phosphate synthase/phosphoribosylanthranilate isomerase [Shigella sonnei]|nr:bifunctional indole-3-glycerol phosphate synthase/phosphoribosylanthranilate isomerase [Shigella sonnei]